MSGRPLKLRDLLFHSSGGDTWWLSRDCFLRPVEVARYPELPPLQTYLDAPGNFLFRIF